MEIMIQHLLSVHLGLDPVLEALCGSLCLIFLGPLHRKRLSNLPTVVQLTNGRAVIHIQVLHPVASVLNPYASS